MENVTVQNADIFDTSDNGTVTHRKASLAIYRKYAAAYRKTGATLASVAAEFGVTGPAVRYGLQALGKEGLLKPRGRVSTKAAKRGSVKIKREAGEYLCNALPQGIQHEYLNEHKTLKMLADKYRTSMVTVAAALRNMGVELRSRGRPAKA